jgi:NAD(P)-dependent dehydrogenase (short-subunit alcohol dehydrogenase family)
MPVAKAGMPHYTRCLADQLRSYDINVNCIAPGDTRPGRFMGTRAVDQYRIVETGTLDRIATVDEVARVVEMFAGPRGRSSQDRCCASMAADSSGLANFSRKPREVSGLSDRPLCARSGHTLQVSF